MQDKSSDYIDLFLNYAWFSQSKIQSSKILAKHYLDQSEPNNQPDPSLSYLNQFEPVWFDFQKWENKQNMTNNYKA